jgi:Carboxypeptidase regulatory-like domain
MKRKFRFLLLFVLASLFVAESSAQSPVAVINGFVKEKDATEVNGATVYLFRVSDSALVRTAVAEKGLFSFRNLPNAIYRLTVTGVGFKKYTGTEIAITPENQLVQVPDIVLTRTDKNALAEVVVFGKRPLIERKIDRTVVNVDAMISSAGSNAFELIEKLPGVTIDMDGNISLKGRSGALVYIDNKATYLSSEDLAGYLKSIGASTLDKVELIPNPRR